MKQVTHSGIPSLTVEYRRPGASSIGPPFSEMINGSVNAVPVAQSHSKVAPFVTSMYLP